MENRYKKIIKEIVSRKDINELVNAYFTFTVEFSCKPDADKFPKYRVGDVIDEDKSVKWNREEVERLIEARANEVKRLNTEKNAISHLFDDAIKQMLSKEYSVSVEETKILWRYAYEEGHSSGLNDVVSYFREFAGMYNELKAVKSK